MATIRPDLVSPGADTENVQLVEDFLNSVATRLRLSALLRFMSYGAMASCAVLLTLRAFTYLVPSIGLALGYSWHTFTIIYMVPVGFSLVKSFTVRYEMISLARYADERLGLKDRLSTAISLPLGIASESFASRIAHDAIVCVNSSKALDVVPLIWRPLYNSALFTLIITLALISLPLSPLSTSSRSYQKLVQVVQSLSLPIVSAPISKSPSTPVPIAPLNASSALAPLSKKSVSTSPGQASQPTKKDEEKLDALSKAASIVDRLLKGQPVHQASSSKPPSLSSKKSSPINLPGGSSGTGNGGGTNSVDQTTLGDKLRQYANRLAQRQMTSGEMSQAAQSLDAINHKLDGYSMPKTQGKLSSAEQDLNDGNQSAAISDIRSAAYYADHEEAESPNGQSGGSGPASKNSLLVPSRNGSSGSGSQGSQGSGSSGGSRGGSNSQQQSNSSGSGRSGTGSGSGGSQSSPASSPSGPSQRGQSGRGYGGGTEKPQFGSPRQISPASLGTAAKPPPILLPISAAGGRYSFKDGSQLSPTAKESSVVPYQNLGSRFGASPEHAVTDQQIPPAYKEIVRRYFSSGTPKE